MELVKDTVYRALWDVLAEMGETVEGIYERNDIGLREREGLPEQKGWYRMEGFPVPETAVTEICENGVRYLVDVENGQKTGFFLDQKYNRAAVARIARGKRVLDCSCSHFMTDELFRKMLESAARDATVSLRQIEARQQSPDHPILWNVPETEYLKFYIFQVV